MLLLHMLSCNTWIELPTEILICRSPFTFPAALGHSVERWIQAVCVVADVTIIAEQKAGGIRCFATHLAHNAFHTTPTLEQHHLCNLNTEREADMEKGRPTHSRKMGGSWWERLLRACSVALLGPKAYRLQNIWHSSVSMVLSLAC